MANTFSVITAPVNTFSVITAPVNTPAMEKATSTAVGISEVRSAWRRMAALSVRSLARAVRT